MVFNTALTGYQEIITDPSYAGQIITFTYPHIGNYGVVAGRRREPAGPHCRGIVIRELARRRSNWRSDGDLDAFLRRHGLAGIAGIDTRRLTRHIRDAGAMPGAFGTADEAALKQAAVARAGHRRHRPRRPGHLRRALHGRAPAPAGSWPTTSASSDRSSRQLGEIATVEVVPASTPAAEVLAREPDGVFLSNGPGDPAAVAVRGRQHPASCSARCRCSASASATSCSPPRSAATTFKLPFGHHGGNHPVRHLATGQRRDHQPEPQLLRRRRLGLRRRRAHPREPQRRHRRGHPQPPSVPAFSVQHHPEAGPGPHDARYLFARLRRPDGPSTTRS